MKTILSLLTCLAFVVVPASAQTAETYDKDSERLGKEQRSAAMDLRKYERTAAKYDPKLAALISEIVGEMGNVEKRLYSPDTGQETVNIETYIIEKIEAAQSQCASACAACAAALPGMKPGQNPGPNGNPMLQPSNLAADETKGKGDGDVLEDRKSDAATGLAVKELPQEYQHILESYLRKLEAKK